MKTDFFLASKWAVACVVLATVPLCRATINATDKRLRTNDSLVINTWRFFEATDAAWDSIVERPDSPLDALVNGIGECERLQCGLEVGKGGCPDERGETTLDSMIMDGATRNMGAVAGLREVNHAIGVARIVLEYTKHSLLVGNAATDFAVSMGFPPESLSTDNTTDEWNQWQQDNCQPNFRKNVSPNPHESCGPYKPVPLDGRPDVDDDPYPINERIHDTIGMIVIDESGKIFVGTSTNGLAFKVPGRVGDTVIPGGGAYADNEVGASVTTGNGDEMMRFLPSLIAVEGMRNGLSPREAAIRALNRVRKQYLNIKGGMVVADRKGNYAGALPKLHDALYASVCGQRCGRETSYAPCTRLAGH